MDFGKKLTAARKERGINQEELADMLGVSRQTIYKWETGITYPDIDKLCDIAKRLGVTPSYLLDESGIATDASVRSNASSDSVLRHFTVFSKAIGFSTMLILFAVAALIAFASQQKTIFIAVGMTVMLITVFIAVIGYVVAGIRHEAFKAEASIKICFDDNERRREQNVFTVKIALGLGLIFAGVIAVVVCGLLQSELAAIYSVSVLLVLVGIACYLFITAGIMHDLFLNPESAMKTEKERQKSGNVEEAVSGCIMLLATAVFLFLGFVFNLWHPAWAAFPIGGVLCGFCSSVIKAIRSGKDADNGEE